MTTPPRTTPGFIRLIHNEDIPVGIIFYCPNIAFMEAKVIRTSDPTIKVAKHDLLKQIRAKDFICCGSDDFAGIENQLDLHPNFILGSVTDVLVDCDPDVRLKELYKEFVNPNYKLPWSGKGILFT